MNWLQKQRSSAETARRNWNNSHRMNSKRLVAEITVTYASRESEMVARRRLINCRDKESRSLTTASPVSRDSLPLSFNSSEIKSRARQATEGVDWVRRFAPEISRACRLLDVMPPPPLSLSIPGIKRHEERCSHSARALHRRAWS